MIYNTYISVYEIVNLCNSFKRFDIWSTEVSSSEFNDSFITSKSSTLICCCWARRKTAIRISTI